MGPRRWPCAAVCALSIGVAVASSQFDEAVALIEKGNPQGAIPMLEQLTRADAKDARAWKALGVAFASMQRYSEAEPAFAQACSLAPLLLDACYYHGRALYALNRFDASLVALRRALPFDRSWKLQLAIAQSAEGLGDAKAAEEAYRAASDRDPSAGAAYGQFLIRQGRWDEAESALRKVVERFPASAAGLTHLGRALLHRDRTTDAIALLERAVAASPNSAQPHLLLANAYVRAGRAADAQPHFEKAWKLEANSQGSAP
ncbi:MAG: tetratricopeptide repeat protein [Bryobacteraceae bacterium]